MKKITISIALLASVLALKAQDTTCTYFMDKEVVEFNYYTSEALSREIQQTKYYDIEVKYGDVLCLDLSDTKRRVRNVITTFFDGTTNKQILKSNDYVYYSPRGASKVSVGRPRTILLQRYTK